MKRSSPNYVRYLETVTKILLKGHSVSETLDGENGEVYSVYNISDLISRMEAQVAEIEHVGVRDGVGFGIQVPVSFSRQVIVGSRIRVNGRWDVEVWFVSEDFLGLYHDYGFKTGQTVEIL